MTFLDGKNILITGVVGTIGNELVNRLLDTAKFTPSSVVGIDNNESGLFQQEQKFADRKNAKFLLCDIRDRASLINAFNGIDVVFHCAAFKHVTLCERSPLEALKTNVDGLSNIIEAARVNSLEKVIFASSDKAVNPTSVMGTTKLLGERLITAANDSINNETVFSSTRFGNVLGSSGAVLSIFEKQLRQGEPLTLTDKRMTRFVMSIADAVDLLIQTSYLATGGEVFVTKMPTVRIEDLATAFIELSAFRDGFDPKTIPIEMIGAKPGEKLYEELMSEDELPRTYELKDFFSILPTLGDTSTHQRFHYPQDEITFPNKVYNSRNEKALTVEKIKTFLLEKKIFSP